MATRGAGQALHGHALFPERPRALEERLARLLISLAAGDGPAEELRAEVVRRIEQELASIGPDADPEAALWRELFVSERAWVAGDGQEAAERSATELLGRVRGALEAVCLEGVGRA